jgi:hypothetical protein
MTLITGEVVALPDLPVVGVVGRGDLEEPGRHLRLGVVRVLARHPVGQHDVVVLDDRDRAPDEGQLDEQALERPSAGPSG